MENCFYVGIRAVNVGGDNSIRVMTEADGRIDEFTDGLCYPYLVSSGSSLLVSPINSTVDIIFSADCPFSLQKISGDKIPGLISANNSSTSSMLYAKASDLPSHNNSSGSTLNTLHNL